MEWGRSPAGPKGGAATTAALAPRDERAMQLKEEVRPMKGHKHRWEHDRVWGEGAGVVSVWRCACGTERREYRLINRGYGPETWTEIHYPDGRRRFVGDLPLWARRGHI